VSDEANEGILNRAEAITSAAQHYGPQIELLRQITNYGTNLILRAYNSSSRGLTDVVVCAVLLKQVVEMIDAVQVLVEAGSTHAAYLPARAGLEASIYVDWILFSEPDKKAKCYIVGNYREEALWARRAIRGTEERAAINKLSKSLGMDWSAIKDETEVLARNRLEEVKRVLAQKELESIDNEYTKLRKNRKRDVEWYELLGVKSLRQVAQQVGRLLEYEVFYAKGSKITHSSSYAHHIGFEGEEVAIRHIRHLLDMHEIMHCVVALSMNTYRSVIRYYRIGELAALNRKYVEEWRQPFQSTRKVVYT